MAPERMLAVLQAMAATRVRGAPTHVLAEFLNELEARGWVVVPAVSLHADLKARVEGVIDALEARAAREQKVADDNRHEHGEASSLVSRPESRSLAYARAADLLRRATVSNTPPTPDTMSDETSVFTCPVCGLADSGPLDSTITCAGVKAWGTAHKPTTMEPVS